MAAINTINTINTINSVTFFKFKEFPGEIRLRVWEIAANAEYINKVVFLDLAVRTKCFCTKHIMRSQFQQPAVRQVNREARAMALLHHEYAFTFTRPDNGEVFHKQYIHPQISMLGLRFHTERRDANNNYPRRTYDLLRDMISPSDDPTSPWFGIPVDFKLTVTESFTYVRIKKSDLNEKDRFNGICVTRAGFTAFAIFRGLRDWNTTWELVRQQMVLRYRDRGCGL